MIKQQIKIEDNGLVDRLEQYPQIVQEESRTFMAIVTAFIQRLVRSFTPVGTTGLLRGSIFTETKQFRASFRGVISSSSPYVETMEGGRAPNSKLPPKGSLVTWIQRKFGVDQFEAEQLEFPVARNIAKFGFFTYPKGAQMFKKAFKKSKNFVLGQQRQLGERIAKRIAG